MKLHFETIKDFEDKYNAPDAYVMHTCSCGGIRELKLSMASILIEDCNIEIVDCPIIECQRCKEENLGNRVPQQIYLTYWEMKKKSFNSCRLTSNGDKRLKYAESANFIYDYRDMNIPAVDIDADPTNPEGFSLPVFFNRKVLNNFYTDDDYELDFFSESYGSIAKNGTDGWEYDWTIVFGINKNNLVVMFLGDLNQVIDDDRATMWLKSYNIQSDHTVVDTELYRGQFCCEFSKPILEMRILKLRDGFYKKISKKYSLDLFHLESEIDNKASELTKPINYSRGEVKDNIIMLDGVLNEGIDCGELRKLCARIVTPPPAHLNDLKTRKLLQAIVANKEGQDKAKEIISPLFYLNDLRVCFAHLIPQGEIDKYEANIVAAFGLSSFSEYRKLYDTLIEKLYELYRYLNIADI